MTETRVSARYAKSLLDLAQERGQLAAAAADMRLFADTTRRSRDLQLLLRNPIVKSDKKLAVLKALFGGKVSDLTEKFFTIISQKAREEELEGIAASFLTQYRVVQGIQQAHLTTAAPLTETQRAEFIELARQQTGKQIELVERVNPELIGGFVLRIGDRQIDNSVSAHLQRMRVAFADHTFESKM